jgi:predicted porin
MKQLAVCLTTLGMTMALTTKCALAQNSVTLYGLADTSLRFVTNADAQGRNRVFMTNGAVTGSRWD